MDNLAIYTYGGGLILKGIFNAIAMLFSSGNGGVVQPIAMLIASFGVIFTFVKMFFSDSLHFLLTQFMFPLLLVPCILMIPTSTVHIEDLITNESYKVDNVPWSLAKFSELISTIGHKITIRFETVMHAPNDIVYNKTGMIFGGQSVLDLSRYKVTNGDFEQNLKRFAKQCMVYDLALGIYSFQDLQKSTDLWNFLKNKSSSVRMIPVKDPNSKETVTSYLNCKSAITKMEQMILKEKEYFNNQELLKNLPLTYQALTGVQKEAKELISQQLMMSFLSNEFSGKGFSENRAYQTQKNTYHILGSLAAESLITIRAILEVLIYVAFVFVAPLAIFPGGFSFFTNWAWLAIWIQLWPPFYSVLNYVQQIMANKQSAGIFYGLTQAEKGLSIFTSAGLQNLHDDIYAMSGYLAASIPFITYAILKGGVQSFIHMAGSMMTPAHSAATQSASEQVTGNYSLANASFGQSSYGNESMLQKNYAPSLTTGHFTKNTGTASTVYGNQETLFKQGNSDLRTSLFSDQSLSQSLQNAKQHAETTIEGAQQNYSENLSNHTRNMCDLSEHLSHSQNFSENISEREATDIQDSARFLQNSAENFGQQFGLTTKESFDILGGVGGGLASFFGIECKLSKSHGASSDEVMSAAKNTAMSSEYQMSFQKVKDFATTKGFSSLDDEGVRLVEGYTKSLDAVQSSQNTLNNSYNELNQISDTITGVESSSQQVRQSLNQEFLNWSSEVFSDQGGYNHVINLLEKGKEEELEPLRAEFLSHKFNPLSNPEGYHSPKEHYQQLNIPKSDNHFSKDNVTFEHASFKTQHFPKDNFGTYKENMVEVNESIKYSVAGIQESVKSKTESVHTDNGNSMESESEKYSAQRIYSGATKNKMFWK